MDYTATLKYGTETVTLPIRGAASVREIRPTPMREIEDMPAELLHAVGEGVIGTKPLRELVTAGDMVTIVVSDITRSWMRQGDVLTVLGRYLHDELHIAFENIVVLVALGTHRHSTQAELRIIAGEYLYQNCRVIDHDCDAPCVHVGTTGRGTRVEVNPLVVGRKVIVVGGTVHHMMAGFGGGRKNILPGVSSRRTIRENHCRALNPNRAHSDARVGTGLLGDNPIHEDMDEAAAMVDTTFSVNIVVAASGRYSGFFCGALADAWKASCDYQRQCYETWIDEEADIVLVSSGGAPKDMNLYQGCKGMLNAMRAVKPGGELLWLCKCPEGCGAPDYTAWLTPLRGGRLDPALRADFTIGGFIFYLTVENLRKAQCRTLTMIDPDIAAPMGMTACKTVEELLTGVDFTRKKVYVIPYGGSVVPMLRGQD